MLSEQTMERAAGRKPAGAGRPVSLFRSLLVVALFLVTVPLMGLADGARVPEKYARNVGLGELPFTVNEWSAMSDEAGNRNLKLDDISLKELDPDDYVWRVYRDGNGIPLDFLVVYGHKKQTFHSPGFCLPGGGWQIVAKSETPVEQDGLPLEMNLFQIQRQYEGHDLRQVVLYCFVQNGQATPSLFQHNLNLLRARILHRRATGALVRVVVPITQNEDVAVARAKAFLSTIYPKLSERIG